MNYELLELIRPVIDPDINVSIVDMGLIYDVKMIEENKAWVLMTFTTPTCPWGPYLVEQIGESLISGKEEVKEVEVEVTWTPQWSLDMMSIEIKLELGMDL